MILTDLQIPQLSQEQLNKFTLQSIRSKPVANFSARIFTDYLKRSEGKQVAGVDIGGDKLASVTYIVRGGKLVRLRKPNIFKSDKGAGYLGQLEKLAELANNYSIPVGISFPGIVENNKLIEEPNIPQFEKDITQKYGGYFSNLFHQVNVFNDAASGLLSASIESFTKFKEAENVVFVINGSGLNSSVLKEDQVYACESGHVEAVPGLNKLNQTKKCGFFEAEYVCIENLSGSKAGVEDLYSLKTGSDLSGEQIAQKMLDSDPLARDLYENSAFIFAHMVTGVCKAFGLLGEGNKTVIAPHGGIFKVPEYGERVKQVVLKNSPELKNWLFTKDYTDNASLDGAAIASLYFGI